jgi:hypothetical protein
MEIEEIKKELQEDQKNHVKECEGEQLEHLWTINAADQKKKWKIINKGMILVNYKKKLKVRINRWQK